MEDNNFGASPTEELVPVTPGAAAPVQPVKVSVITPAAPASQKNKKLWVVIGVMAGVIILILGVGGFFVFNLLSESGGSSSDEGTTLPAGQGNAAAGGSAPIGSTTSDGTTPDGTTPDSTTSDGTTPDGTTPDSTTPTGPSIDDLLNNPGDYTPNPADNSVTLGMEITSLLCTSDSLNVVVGLTSGSANGVAFFVSPSTLPLSFFEQRPMIAPASEEFSLNISGLSLDLASLNVDIAAINSSGYTAVLGSASCP